MTDTLLTDWIDALSVVRYGIDPYGVRKILESTSLRWASRKETSTEAARFTFRTIDATHRAIVVVNPRIESFYRVERVEILASVALVCHQARLKLKPVEMIRLYRGIGVWNGLLINPVVRWRYLNARQDYRTLAVSQFEDRPACPVCHRHVSSGHLNPKIHDACRDYVRTVYVPALKRQEKANAKTV